MLFIGAGLIFLFTFIVWREYSSYLDRSIGELTEFVAFLRNMSERMECYLESPASWVKDYSSPWLENVGFLHKVREGNELLVSYEDCSDSFCMNAEARSVIFDLFSRIGEGYLTNELETVNSATEKLAHILDAEKNERTNRIKAAGAVFGAISVGIVILIL